MKKTIRICFAIGAIIAGYGIYSFNNPGTDGALFGTVMTIVAGLAGYSIGGLKRET